MLDNDDLTTSTSADNPPASTEAPRKTTRRPRKAAADEAGAEANATDPSETAEAAPPRKRTRKAAPEPAAATEPVLAVDASVTTAKKSTPKKSTAKKAASKNAEALPSETGETSEQAPPRKARPAKAKPSLDPEAPATGAPALAAPSVLFQPPSVQAAPAADAPPPRKRARKAVASSEASTEPLAELPLEAVEDESTEAELTDGAQLESDDVREAAIDEANGARRRRRRGRRGRGRAREEGDSTAPVTETSEAEPDTDDAQTEDGEDGEDGAGSPAARRRRRRRRADSTDGEGGPDDPPNTVVHVRERRSEGGAAGDDGVRGVRGSTRLEAKRQRRRDGRDSGRRRPSILSEAEFLARRESVDRVMAVRQSGDRTQIAVLEDGVLVEHYVTRASATSYVGNVYLGRVQNVLPSMEAAFVDIGKGRNGVLYAGEVNWEAAGLEGKSRAIENAMNAGDPVLVQVTKDPIGHKGARLTSQISLPGRFLVYVPGGGMTGISRKLPDTERQRLKAILKKIVPEDAGVIIRTAAEGASEEELTHDVERLKAEWESISAKAENRKNAPALVHGEPDLATRVVRDVFNEDFNSLVVQGDEAWQTVSGYLADVAPDLAARARRHTADSDLFHDLRVDEGLAKALDRKVWLPSGGSLVIDRTEAMTVIDVNTGKFIGSGGNLEQTVTRNNLEAAEEIVRQLRLRDVGGIVVIDFIDMVLESNRDLVLRRLTECLGRDRTKHQVAEVTSLGLVQMTRKRVGEGLLEAFSEPCEVCRGRGVIIHSEPVDQVHAPDIDDDRPAPRKRGSRRGGGAAKVAVDEPVHIDSPEEIERRRVAASAMAAIHRAASIDDDDVEDAAEVIEVIEVVQPTQLVEVSEPVGVSEVPEPEVLEVAYEPAVVAEHIVVAAPRRRRGASRPAGPPVAAS